MTTSAPPPKAPSPWDENKRSSDGEIKGVELGLHSLTLSPHFSGGGRPPALSVSSLSTIGDDHVQPQNRSVEGMMGSLVGTPPSPSSPPRRFINRQVGPQNSIGEGHHGHTSRSASFPSPIGTASRPTTGTSSSYTGSSPLIIRPSSSVEGSNSDPIFGSNQESTFSFLSGKALPPPPALESARDIDARNNDVDKGIEGFVNSSIDAPITGSPFSSANQIQKDNRAGPVDGGYNINQNKNVITPRKLPRSQIESPLFSNSFDQSHQQIPEQSPGGHYFDDGGLIGLGVLKDRSQSSTSPNLTSPGGVSLATPSSPLSEILSGNNLPYNGTLSTFSAPVDNRNTNDMLDRLLTNRDQTKNSVPSTPRGMSNGSHFGNRPPLSGNRSSNDMKPNESPSFNSFDQQLQNQQREFSHSDVDLHGATAKNRVDHAHGGPPRPNLRHATSDITNCRARVSPGTSMIPNNSVSIGSSSSFIDEYSQVDHISQHRQYPTNRARAASMGSPGAIGEHDHFQAQVSHTIKGRPIHGNSFDDTLRRQSNQGNDSMFGADGSVGREETRQMHFLKSQSNQTHQSLQSDQYHSQHPQIHHDQQDQLQHQRQLRPMPHQLQGGPQRLQHSGDQRHPHAHPSFSGAGREQDYYDDGYGQQGQGNLRNQHQTNSSHHQHAAGGQFGSHSVPHQQEVFREPVTPGTGGRSNFEYGLGAGPGMEGTMHRSVPHGSDIGGVMNRGGNILPHGTPATPHEGSSRGYDSSTIDPYHQHQHRFPGQQYPGQQHPGQQHPGQQHPGQQHPGRANQGQFQHDGDQGQLYQHQLGMNRGIQQQFSGEEFHSRGGSEMMHAAHMNRRGSGGVPVLPQMDEMMGDTRALGMSRGNVMRNDPGQGPYQGNVQQHRSHSQQQPFVHPGQRRIEPDSPVGHHHGPPVMMSPAQHHNRQHNRGLSYDADVGHPFPAERVDSSTMGVGMAHNNSDAPQDGMVPHHQHHQAGFVPNHMGARCGPVHHLAMSPPQSISSGVPSADQMVSPGMPPHFSPVDPVQQQQQQQQQQANPGSASAPAISGPRVVYNVKFKRTQRSFILGQRIPRDIKIGCYVKVEADRGEDLGIVLSRMPAEKFNSTGRSNFRMGVGTSSGGASMPGVGEISPGIGGVVPVGPTAGGAADLKRIIRLATHDEVSLLSVKREEEDELLKICRAKVRQRGLPMNVVDAEYQFDRHKLTFFFEAEGRIDFRELVRDLFSIYKTRIWMQQLDKNGVSTGGACGDESSGSTSPSNDAGQSSVTSFASEDSDSGRPLY